MTNIDGFGEMALLAENIKLAKRSATCIASENKTICLTISRK
jgi:hypothetical protein